MGIMNQLWKALLFWAVLLIAPASLADTAKSFRCNQLLQNPGSDTFFSNEDLTEAELPIFHLHELLKNRKKFWKNLEKKNWTSSPTQYLEKQSRGEQVDPPVRFEFYPCRQRNTKNCTSLISTMGLGYSAIRHQQNQTYLKVATERSHYLLYYRQWQHLLAHHSYSFGYLHQIPTVP